MLPYSTSPKDIPERCEKSSEGSLANSRKYSTRLPPRHHKSLPHEVSCHCVQCFMGREQAEMESVERPRVQELGSLSETDGSISPLHQDTPVLIFDLSDMEPTDDNDGITPVVVVDQATPPPGSTPSDSVRPPIAILEHRSSSAPPDLIHSDHRSEDQEDSDGSVPWWERDYTGDEDDEEEEEDDDDHSTSPRDDIRISDEDYYGDTSDKSTADPSPQIGMMKSKEGYYIVMNKKTLRQIENRSPDGNIDDKFTAKQLVEILRESGYRVPVHFGHSSLLSDSEGDPATQASSPARSGASTPYTPMPVMLPDVTGSLSRLPSSSSVSAPIFVPQLYSLKRPGSPDLPAPQDSRNNEATFREAQVKLDSVRGMESVMSPASSPRPHHSRPYGSAIVDRKAFDIAFSTNPVLTARISPLMRVAIYNSLNRSRSQDVLHSDRNKSSVSAKTDRASFVVGSGLEQAPVVAATVTV